MNIYIKKASGMDGVSLEGCTARYDETEDKMSVYGKMVSHSAKTEQSDCDYEVGVNFCDRNDSVIYSKDAGHYGSAARTKETTFYLSLINFKNRINFEELYYIELFVYFRKKQDA